MKESLHGSCARQQRRPVVVVTGMGVITSLGMGKPKIGPNSRPENPAFTASPNSQ